MGIIFNEVESSMSDLTDYQEAVLDALVHQQPDWSLQDLVRIANDHGVGFGITLVVGGSLVTGKIIGGREYFELLGDKVGDALGFDEENRVNIFQSYIAHYYPPTDETSGEESEDDEDDREPIPSYIHLKDARVFHGATQIPSEHEGHLWRGRMASVAGFSFGEMSRD